MVDLGSDKYNMTVFWRIAEGLSGFVSCRVQRVQRVQREHWNPLTFSHRDEGSSLRLTWLDLCWAE